MTPVIFSTPYRSPPPTLNFVRTLSDSGNEDYRGLSTDSSGNVYAVARTTSDGAGSNDVLIAKYNNAGILQWQRTLGGASNDSGWAIDSDGSGNIYLAGETFSSGLGSADMLLAKYNSSGTIQWQRTLGNVSPNIANGVAIDGSGNAYIVGDGGGATIAKYNTSGTLQWQRLLTGVNANAVATFGSDVYLVGFVSASSGQVFIAKYNSSGTIQWQRTLGGGSLDHGNGVATDSSGNVYLVGQTQSAGAGAADVLIAKYNSSGAIQWQRALGGGSGDVGHAIAIDSSNNLYITAEIGSAGAGGDDCLAAKYNSSGVLQWQRAFGAGGSDIGRAMATDTLGNFYLGGQTSIGPGTRSALIVGLPDTGQGTGTYTSFTYQAISLTDQLISLTDAAGSQVESAGSMTSQTSSLTDQVSTLTDTSY